MFKIINPFTRKIVETAESRELALIIANRLFSESNFLTPYLVQ